MGRILSRALVAGALAAASMATSAHAKVSLLIERDAPNGSSLQAGVYEFASVDDYVSGTGAVFRESAFLLNDVFSFGGLDIAADGKVNLLIERDAPNGSSLQAGLYQFASVDDYIAGTGAVFQESAFRLNDVFSFGGLSITDGGGSPTGAVPEPATWTMMILGFGLAGGAMRRRARLPS